MAIRQRASLAINPMPITHAGRYAINQPGRQHCSTLRHHEGGNADTNQ
jgi:hypothetical protein